MGCGHSDTVARCAPSRCSLSRRRPVCVHDVLAVFSFIVLDLPHILLASRLEPPALKSLDPLFDVGAGLRHMVHFIFAVASISNVCVFCHL